MNTIELLYQIFRARYNLDAVRQSLEKKYRLALIGTEPDLQKLRTWLGEPTLASGGTPEEDTLLVTAPLSEEANETLRRVDAAIYHLGAGSPDEATLRQQAEWIPPGIVTLWIREAAPEEPADPPVTDVTLPRVQRVDPARAAEQLPRLCLNSFPDLAIRLARDFSRVRLECARRLTSRTATRMAMVAAASSVTVSVPLVGHLLGMLAVTGETLVITASQLRLCLLMGALYGRKLDFFDRVDELWPVVGSALGWRTLARQLVGFIPVAGPVAKAGIAYSGTWVIGESARLFYELGEHLPDHVKKQVEDEARKRAREEAARFVKNLKEGRLEEGAAWPPEDDELWPADPAGEHLPQEARAEEGRFPEEPLSEALREGRSLPEVEIGIEPDIAPLAGAEVGEGPPPAPAATAPLAPESSAPVLPARDVPPAEPAAPGESPAAPGATAPLAPESSAPVPPASVEPTAPATAPLADLQPPDPAAGLMPARDIPPPEPEAPSAPRQSESGKGRKKKGPKKVVDELPDLGPGPAVIGDIPTEESEGR